MGAPGRPDVDEADAIGAPRCRAWARCDHDAADAALDLVAEATEHRSGEATARPGQREIDGIRTATRAGLRSGGTGSDRRGDREREGETGARHAGAPYHPRPALPRSLTRCA
jgi:hypothetical protein